MGWAELKMRLQTLLTVGSVAVVIGFVLWLFVGPAVMRAALAPPPLDHEWAFFQSYSWLSGGGPPLTPKFWLGLSISWIGLFLVAGGVAALVYALVRTSFYRTSRSR